MKKICIVGYGAIAASHAKALVSAQNAEFYAVCDINPERIAICQKYRPLESLLLEAEQIGGGLFLQHGFATVVAAKRVGKNCWINQQVTVGYKDNGCPVIGDDAMITCGAKVLGNITVGNGAVIGANAVVIRDVEPGAVMGGIPAKRLG